MKAKGNPGSGDGFVRATAGMTHRIILAVDGMERTGKTDFVLRTAPEPIVVLPVDPGLEGVIQKHQAKREILVPRGAEQGYVIDCDLSRDKEEVIQRAAAPVWEKLIEDYTKAFKVARTIVADTMSGVYELRRLAEFGTLETNIMRERTGWGRINLDMKRMFRRAYEARERPVNFIAIHRMTEIWKNNKPTGQFKRMGFKETGYEVMCTVQTYYDVEESEFAAMITDSRHDPTLVGTEFSGKMRTFRMIASSLMPDVPAEAWK